MRFAASEKAKQQNENADSVKATSPLNFFVVVYLSYITIYMSLDVNTVWFNGKVQEKIRILVHDMRQRTLDHLICSKFYFQVTIRGIQLLFRLIYKIMQGVT